MNTNTLNETAVYRGYTLKQLDQAFELVRHPDHWKLPIEYVIVVEDLDLVDAAVGYFTGEGVAVTDVYRSEIDDKWKCLVSARGYYAVCEE